MRVRVKRYQKDGRSRWKLTRVSLHEVEVGTTFWLNYRVAVEVDKELSVGSRHCVSARYELEVLGG